MSLYGAFDKKRHFAELASADLDQHGNLRTPTQRRNSAFQNLTGDASILASEVAALQGLTSTSTELNLLDGSDSDTPVASTAAILDSAGALRTAANVGTSAATSVVEYGDGINHVTVLTATALAFPDVADNAASAVGDLIYTFPAGDIVIEYAYVNIALTIDDAVQTDTPDVGLGTVIGTGAVATLDTTGEFEDIITGQLSGAIDGTNFVNVAGLPSVGAPLYIEAADAHTVHVNAADTWANTTTQGLTYTGTVVIKWAYMGA